MFRSFSTRHRASLRRFIPHCGVLYCLWLWLQSPSLRIREGFSGNFAPSQLFQEAQLMTFATLGPVVLSQTAHLCSRFLRGTEWKS